MRYAVNTMLFTALLLGLASVVAPRAAFADVFDGNWSVLVVTERGTCDRAYRYSVQVANAQVRYNGDAKGINLAGTVTPNGHVNVSIRLRDRSAEGVGRISDKAGAGSWHGNGANNTTCAGTWEAERR
jgi:hypothetical protein